jgi:hypothetical protein
MINDESSRLWSLLGYTVADDRGTGGSLDDAVQDELAALCHAADFRSTSIAVQVDYKKRKSGVFRAALAALKARRFNDVPVETEPLWRAINAALAQSKLALQFEPIDLNAASDAVLREFLRFGSERCPAEQYVVFMYGHASGPMGMFYDRDSHRHVPHTMRLNDVASAIGELQGKAAIVLFRDCYMNTLEAAYELRGVAKYMIASQSEVPIAGIWPWLDFLRHMKPGATPLAVAQGMAEQLGSFLDAPTNRTPFANVPISLIDVDAVADVVDPLRELGDAVDAARADATRWKKCGQALDASRTGYPDDHSNPGDPSMIDVLTFCAELQERLPGDEVAGKAGALADVITKGVVLHHHTQPGSRYRGVSLFCKPSAAKDVDRSYLLSGDEDEARWDECYYHHLGLVHDSGWWRIALMPPAAG